MSKKVELISETLKDATYLGNTEIKIAMRSIISMFPELNKKKEIITDSDVEDLCKKAIKIEKQRLLYKNNHITDVMVKGLTSEEISKLEKAKLIECDSKLTSNTIEVLKTFLPISISKNEIINFINKNIDFSKLKNKMAAIGIIKTKFGNSVDPLMVKDIISSWDIKG